MTSKTGGPDDNDAQAGHLVFVKHRRAGENDASPESWGPGDVAPTLDAAGHGPRTATAVVSLAIAGDFSTSEDIAQTVRAANGMNPGCIAVDMRNAGRSSGSGTGTQGDGIREDGTSFTISAEGAIPAIVQPMAIRGRDGGAELEIGPEGAPYNALRAGDGGSSRQALISINDTVETTVRRLTELECERLQGFPDQWTDDQSGAARYRQLGNTVAVPCVEWLVGRLVRVDAEVRGVVA